MSGILFWFVTGCMALNRLYIDEKLALMDDGKYMYIVRVSMTENSIDAIIYYLVSNYCT